MQTLGLNMLSKGCFTGLEDRIYGNTHYSLNVECASNKGTIYTITGKKLVALEKIMKIWSQVIEYMDKNCKYMQEKYNNILKSRSKFPFGKRLPTTHDPEIFIEFRKIQTSQPSANTKQKIEKLK